MRDAPKAKVGDIGGRRPKAGSRKDPANAPPTLAQQGIDKHLADRAGKAERMSEEKFDFPQQR